MPQCFGSTPWITTWMCSGAAPLDSTSAFVSASIIFGTDSSVTRRSYSLTSIIGTGLPPSARPARQRARPYGLSAQCDIVVPFLQRYRPTGHGTGRHREQHRAPRDRRRASCHRDGGLAGRDADANRGGGRCLPDDAPPPWPRAGRDLRLARARLRGGVQGRALADGDGK